MFFDVCELAYLDVETTGLGSKTGDRICEVAVVSAHKGIVQSEFSTLVNPETPIPYGATAVSGITDEMVRGAPSFREIALDLLSVLRGRVVVAHNASFDIGFLASEFSRVPLLLPRNPVVDTLLISRRRFEFPNNRLETIASVLDISTSGHHRALMDVHITKKVLERLLADLSLQGHKLESLEDVVRLQSY